MGAREERPLMPGKFCPYATFTVTTLPLNSRSSLLSSVQRANVFVCYVAGLTLVMLLLPFSVFQCRDFAARSSRCERSRGVRWAPTSASPPTTCRPPSPRGSSSTSTVSTTMTINYFCIFICLFVSLRLKRERERERGTMCNTPTGAH